MSATLVIPEAATQTIFERGDHLYMTTPVSVFTPSDQQMEELAFKSAVKKTAPNDNIVWLRGQYVEADHANLNGAQWRASELAIKNLTPRLMPVTVMHDPRTAVGTIADTKLLTPEKDGVSRARIDTVLALWAHRFPEAVQEAVENANAGTLMQSMECMSPWYECSECSALFHKLPGGAEQANWCSHLKASNPSGGFSDVPGGPRDQSANASRILGDVTFTGTGLIYGSRGARGAYTEAHLEQFQDELASYHSEAHGTQRNTSIPIVTTASGGTSSMGLVQIEQSELDTLRRERDEARASETTIKQEKAEAERKVTELETAKAAAEEAKATAEQERDAEKEKTAQATMKDTRLAKLGDGFMAKLGDFTKGRLQDAAAKLSDDEWEARLTELEEIASVKRDAKVDGKSTPSGKKDDEKDETANNGATTFEDEEVASFVGGGAVQGERQPVVSTPAGQRSVVSSLAAGFKK